MSTTTDFLAKLQKMTEEKSVQPKTSNKTAAVNLPELGSAAVLFSPKKNQTKGKSTQQKKKVDPALQAFIDQAVTTKKAAVVRQDITIPVERSDEPSQELVYEAKPGDFISAESFRATKQKTGTLNVAAYIRVSTDSSDQENSYETQERYFNQLIEANPEWNPIGVYSDYGISGTNSEKRTGFRRLLRHCKAGKIDRVICKSISRFARNTADFMMALDLLRENNVTILFEKENLDTADPTSEFILTTLGAIAQEESRSISGNINLGNKMRFKRGDVRNVENLQKIDFMERDRCFYKKQIIALQKDAEAAHKRMSLLQSQKDAMETRRDLLGDETIDEAALTERKEEIERLRKRIEQDETEAQKLEDKLDYLEDYWDELEDDYDRREEAVQWMRQLPKGREGTVAFLNGLTGEHCKAFILSITVYSPLKYSVHWFDDTRTKVEMDSNIEDFRNTASYYDGQVMRDNAYRKRFIK